VTNRTPRAVLAATLAALALVSSAAAQTGRAPGNSIVIITGELGMLPIPTLMEGPASNVSNRELSDQLFLRLVRLGPTMLTAGDRNYLPQLARSWTRRDSVTLAFDLDPRARWQDGVPVTARDVVFALSRARNPAIAPQLAQLLKHITSVTAEGDRRVVFGFSHSYAEQLYDATFHVAPLPAHLLASLSPDSLAHSDFVTHPVGDGPYRLVRSVPGQFVELVANENFFLGKPKLERVIIRLATDPDARVNVLLSGQADAMDIVPPPLDNLRRIEADPSLRLIPVPSTTVGYLLYNTRDPRNLSQPHPILADVRVRRALTLGLDRRLLAQVVFGSHAEVPYGPVSPVLWIRYRSPKPERQNEAEAKRLLAAAGWVDTDGDGTRDRDGHPLTLSLSLPNTSGNRRQMSQLIQEQLRQLGVRVDLQQYEFSVWNERRSAGNFDIDFSAVNQDPTPSGLTQGWTCAGGTNVAKYCNPRVDSLMERAVLGREDPGEAWIAALRQIEADAPAAFLYAPTNMYAVSRRFRNVTITPTSSWLLLREWSADPATHRQGK
jgi:peptide/nickel transport system substrate-binding protein